MKILVRLKSIKITFLFLFLASIPLLAYGNHVFERCLYAINSKVHPAYMEKFQKNFKDEIIRGRGYVTHVTVDVDNNKIVHLSTEKDFSSKTAIAIAVYIKKRNALPTQAKWKRGRNVGFSGRLQEIRMNMIIVYDGNIR